MACLLAMASATALAAAKPGYVRVNQAGYEVGSAARAYLMTKATVSSATFKLVSESGRTVATAKVGARVGSWAHSETVSYNVYALDFKAPAGVYKLVVSGDVSASSPQFAVGTAETLYGGLLLNTLFFYETERDGAKYIRNALRRRAGHVNDVKATRYRTPPLDENNYIDLEPPAGPLVKSGLPDMDAAGGWWDAGDYVKYVSNISYVTALMEIGVRDFPAQMGAGAGQFPVAPPVSVSTAGASGEGAPESSDFTAEARFGVDWLLKMWDGKRKALSYQVDTTQAWNYYGYGDPTSAGGNCGGTYPSAYCLITQYDIWIQPQESNYYWQWGDSASCDPHTTYYICHRPVFTTPAAQSKLSPNLAGRLAASFALCSQLERSSNATRADECLVEAETLYGMADLSYDDPAPYPDSGSCSDCLLTTVPANGETIWDDDMELGATELYFALADAKARGKLPAGLEVSDPQQYLKQGAQFAKNYVDRVYAQGYGDTLNLYDVSGLAHFELYRAMKAAGGGTRLAMTPAAVKSQLLMQVDDAVAQADNDAWQFGEEWDNGDVTSRGAGLSVMADEAYWLTGKAAYDQHARRWLGNILGANAWGSSFIVGAGTTFPNCIQHQVANLAGSLEGTSGGTPILWGAAVEGPANDESSGMVDGMKSCPADGKDAFAQFNGNSGDYDETIYTYYKDNVESYTTTEPAVDLTATTFLMWSWRMAGKPSFPKAAD